MTSDSPSVPDLAGSVLDLTRKMKAAGISKKNAELALNDTYAVPSFMADDALSLVYGNTTDA